MGCWARHCSTRLLLWVSSEHPLIWKLTIITAMPRPTAPMTLNLDWKTWSMASGQDWNGTDGSLVFYTHKVHLKTHLLKVALIWPLLSHPLRESGMVLHKSWWKSLNLLFKYLKPVSSTLTTAGFPSQSEHAVYYQAWLVTNGCQHFRWCIAHPWSKEPLLILPIATVILQTPPEPQCMGTAGYPRLASMSKQIHRGASLMFPG